MLGTVVQIDGYDPVAAAAVTLRLGSHDVVSVCNLNGQIWWPAIAALPTLRYDLFDGSFGQGIEAPSSSMAISIEPWPNFARHMLADARFRLWTGEVGAAWDEWTLRFDGRVSTQPAIANGRADIDFAVDDRWLDAPLLATYAGTGGAEGPAPLKGQVKPLAIGAPRYVAGTLVDVANSVFQISNGSIQGVTQALERLARYGASYGDYASLAALAAATIPAGRWATAKAAGFARLGAPPTGQVSFLAQGDNGGPDSWIRLPGRIITRIATISGGAGKIDTASLAALDTARPYNLSVNITAQTTARELIQRIAASINAVAGVSWLGKLFVAPVGIGAPSLTLATDGSALPPVAAVSQIAVAAPWWKLAIGAERTETVHALSDIAFYATLVPLGAYAAGTTYREGNLVEDQGSTWLYINPAPTAGNPPPTLPTTSNAYWRVLAQAGTDGTNGDPGLPGTDGDPTYSWFAYANAADGSVDFTTGAAGGRLYVGLAANKTTATESTNPADYSWTRLRGADGVSALVISCPDAITIAASAGGTPKSAELPRSFGVRATLGASNVTSTATISVTPSTGVSASYSAGVVEITAAVDGGYVDVTAAIDGITQARRTAVAFTYDAAPGGTVQDDTFDPSSLTSTSYPSTGQLGPISLEAGSTGIFAWAFSLKNNAASGSSTVYAKAQYRVFGSGSAWSDFAAETEGSPATGALPGEPADFGLCSASDVTSAIFTAGTAYEFQLIARKGGSNSGVQGSFWVQRA